MESLEGLLWIAVLGIIVYLVARRSADGRLEERVQALERIQAAFGAELSRLRQPVVPVAGPAVTVPASPVSAPAVPPSIPEPSRGVADFLLPSTSPRTAEPAPTMAAANPIVARPVVSVPVTAAVARGTAPPRSETPPEPEGPSWEQRIGGQWLNLLGIITLFATVAFGLKLAYDAGYMAWIFHLPPLAYLMLGWLAGFGLLAGSQRLKARMPFYSDALAGGSLATLYLTTFAGYSLYHTLSSTQAVAGLALVGALAIGLALRRSSQLIGWMGIVLAYAAPVVIGARSSTPAPLFLYLTALNLAVLVISVVRRWPGFRGGSFGGTALLYLAWYLGAAPGQEAAALVFVGGSGAIFLAAQAFYPLVRNEAGSDSDLYLAVLNPLLTGLAAYPLLHHLAPGMVGPAALGVGGLYWVMARAIRLRRGEQDYLEQIYFATSVVYTVLAVPLWFHGRRVMVAAWALLGAALAVTGTTTASSRTRAWSVPPLTLALGWLLLYDAWVPPATRVMFFNARGFSFAVVILSLVAAGWAVVQEWRAQREAKPGAVTPPALVLGVLTALVVGLVDLWISLDAPHPWAAVGWAVAAALALAFGALLGSGEIRVAALATGLASSAAAFVLAGQAEWGLTGGWERFPGFLATFALWTGVAWYYQTRARLTDTERGPIASLAVGAAAAVALGWSALELGPGWLPVTWAVIGGGVLLVGALLDRPVVRLQAVTIAGLLSLEVLARELTLPANHALLFHSRCAAAVGLLLLWVGCAILLRKGSEIERSLVPVVLVLGNLLALGWLSLEAADVASRLAPARWADEAGQFGISTVWVLYAAVALLIGFRRKVREVRWAGIALLMASVVKVYLFDLSFLPLPYRVLTFFVLALVLLGVSYAYQKQAPESRNRTAGE